MPILHQLEDNRLAFNCPGCGENHAVYVNSDKHPNWTWNGDLNKPTFSPSILVHFTKVLVANDEMYRLIENKQPIPHKDMVCHSFVTDGKIQFLNDCTHDLAGMTVELLPFD